MTANLPAPLTATDQEARQRALDTTASFLVQAPAGSGKTELLIQRYLALLATVSQPESIVAITFTRKAAGEMQSRILQALERAARDEQPEKPHERISHELAKVALEQDRKQGWNILAHPSRLRIQTIDSLCSAITRRMPLLARLGSEPSVTEDPEPLYIEAAQRTLALVEREGSWGPAIATVLTHLDNNVQEAAKLIVRMLQIRDQWLPIAVEGGSLRAELERAMENAIADGLALATRLFPPDLRPLAAELAAFAASHVQDGDAIKACANLESFPEPVAAERSAWDGLCRLLMTGNGDAFRKRVDTRQGFPSAKGPRAARPQLFQQRKDSMHSLLESLSGRDDLLEALQRVRILPPAKYTDTQWKVMESLFTVLKLAVANLRLVFGEKGEVDFCEIAASAREALGDIAAPTDLALALDARLEHLLVDEFQDTSVSQFELLERLTAGWEEADGRTVFLVGDPMQSIYRFRKAEVGLFLKVTGGSVGQVWPGFLRLDANHRSQAGIVNWINAKFAGVFPGEADIATGAITYAPCAARNPEEPGDAVTLHALSEGEDDAEAALVLDIVREARKANPKGTTAILVRARAHLARIVPVLKREGLPFRSIEIDCLSDRSVVLDLMSLTRAMLHFADRPSWLAILRAPWCGLDLHDLHSLVNNQPDTPIWELISGDLSGLSPEGRQRVERARNVLSEAFASRGRLRLRRQVETTWWALGGPACVTAEALQDAADYLDLLEKHEQAGDLPDFDGFREKVEKLYARPDPEADGTLELMTIHKAKGLQFDTVIVPGMGRIPKPESQALLLTAERPQVDGVDRLVATIRETGTDQDPVYEYLRDLERIKSANENVRHLYVACTRARSRLHLIGYAAATADGEVKPKARSLLDTLWPGLDEAEQQKFIVRAGPAKKETAPAQPPKVELKRLPIGWQSPALPAALPLRAAPVPGDHQPSYLWVGDLLRHVGTVVHSALQRIGEEGAEHWDEQRVMAGCDGYRVALANLGTPPSELERGVERVRDAVLRTLRSKRGQWILARRDEARCEYAIAGVLNGETVHLAVDRSFDEDGVRWIVDYKTSDHQGGSLESFLDEEQRRYRDQLERYAALLNHSAGRVKVGLYFPLLDAWREWSPNTANS